MNGLMIPMERCTDSLRPVGHRLAWPPAPGRQLLPGNDHIHGPGPGKEPLQYPRFLGRPAEDSCVSL